MKLCCYGTPFLPAACGLVLQRVELILSAWDVLVLKPENQHVTLNSLTIKNIQKKNVKKLFKIFKQKIKIFKKNSIFLYIFEKLKKVKNFKKKLQKKFQLSFLKIFH